MTDQWHLGEDGHGRGGFITEIQPDAVETEQRSVLAFMLSNTTKELVTQFHDVFVQIMYLRTYKNAGQAEVRLCGKSYGTLDALWSDYTNNHISVPEWKEIRLVFPDCVESNYTYPTIEFIHKYNPKYHDITTTARGHHKFKVVSIKVCAENG